MALIFALERQMHMLLKRRGATNVCLCRSANRKFDRHTVQTMRTLATQVTKNDTCRKQQEHGDNEERSPRSHTLLDITDESVDLSQKVLTQSEFLHAKQTRFVTKEEYENLKPHEVRKHIQATMKPGNLEQKYGKKLAKKIIKRKQLAEHSKVTWNPRERVAETNIKELTMDDIDIERRPRVEKIHFINKSIYDMTEDEFYGSFFRDRERQFDGMGKKLQELETQIINQKKAEASATTRTRIAPKLYWIKPNYTSPTLQEAATLNSMDLRFVMMNEAAKNITQAKINTDLWHAFLKRIMEISPKVCIRTLLRFLQIIAKVQIKPNENIKKIVDVIHSRRAELKPKHYVFLFQALSRLRLRDQRLYDDIYEMILCWPILRNNFIIKAANAIAKLDVSDTLLLQPLKQVIAKRLENFSATDCVRVKAITVLELFTEDMIPIFLNKCEHHKQHFRHYSRHLEVIELYLRLIRDDIYQKLQENVKHFLIQARQNTLDKQVSATTMRHSEDSHAQTYHMPTDYAKREIEIDEEEDDYEQEEETRLTNINGKEPQREIDEEPPHKGHYHEDITRILTLMGVPHRNFMRAGPFVMDIYEPKSNTVIEINTEYQYYHDSTRLTAMARRRHEIIAAMGFRLLHIPYRWWRQLDSDEHKIEALRKLIQYT